jgi:hypothetical protein
MPIDYLFALSKSRQDSDLQYNIKSGLRDIGRINRVGRKWIARFDVSGREAFDSEPLPSKKAALEWMETEAANYNEILASMPNHTRFLMVHTRNGMYAADLARLVDILTEEVCPVVVPMEDRGREPTYLVRCGNDPVRSSFQNYMGGPRKDQRLCAQVFLIENPATVDRLKAEFPGKIKVVNEVILEPHEKFRRYTLEEAKAELHWQGASTNI